MDAIEAGTIIHQLQERVYKLERELDQTKKWGEMCAKKWRTVVDAVDVARKISQEL